MANLLTRLGIELPIIQAPMAGTSTPGLAAAVTNAGALGSLGVGAVDACGADGMIAAFVPQIGNGLCAAPVVGDPLTPPDVLGGQCQQPVNGDDSSWVLARLDKDCKKADGTPKLDYWGIQYYNAGQAACCGGGVDDASQVTSAYQSYKNLANGWPASGDTTQASNPWHQWAYYPGPWAEFDGFGADRLVLGKPGCQGCAGSDYLDLGGMQSLIGQLDHKLTKTMEHQRRKLANAVARRTRGMSLDEVLNYHPDENATQRRCTRDLTHEECDAFVVALDMAHTRSR